MVSENLIKIESLVSYCGKPAIIDGIAEGAYSYHVKTLWGGMWLFLDNLQPLKLTPEMLIKNGFEEVDGLWVLPHKDKKPEIRWHLAERAEVVPLYNESIRGRNSGKHLCCEGTGLYAHELQYMLSWCRDDKEFKL